jgi:hypothetical protein
LIPFQVIALVLDEFQIPPGFNLPPQVRVMTVHTQYKIIKNGQDCILKFCNPCLTRLGRNFVVPGLHAVFESICQSKESPLCFTPEAVVDKSQIPSGIAITKPGILTSAS